MVRRCATASALLSRLAEELLTLARLETGLVTAYPEPTDLARIVRTVAAAANDPAAVEVHTPSEVNVRTDADLLRRALGLLVDNALKYGDRATIVVSNDGSIIEIRDRGPGIPGDVRD